MAEEKPKGEELTGEAAPVDTQQPDVESEAPEYVDANLPPLFPIRQEPVFESDLKPLEPLEPLTDADADRIAAAMQPGSIMAPMMPTLGALAEPAAPRLRGFSSSREPLQFTCPYGFSGQCCGCRYLPCNELTLAVLGHVAGDYGPGGRCSADD